MLAEKWRNLPATSSVDVVEWRSRFAVMKAEHDRLRLQGRWTHGPADLMSICGFHRKELAHGSALRWLCDPTGSHGLGDRFLVGLIRATGEPLEVSSDTTAETEISRERSRADLVVYGDRWKLVMELKIDAIESERQCQRLYEDWRMDRGVRWLFITLSGRAPVTTTTEQAALAWHRLSWSRVLSVLDDAVQAAGEEAPEVTAVAEYRRSLSRLTKRRWK
ncbi:PD-(D/E)XK nuclease family protein [Actinoplanes lobatus]|uniref:Uncharacterized protein n=2 Tax=Actinoplanes lobatus TaxID=113568 RepID=A0A7W7HR37_9ACTN|nr:PD-(D/E)XK nuclease family protein [Actinoplanes lobatus]MBB4755069.1 hypothetical protein [Actinoplanes lobatus]